MGSPVDLTLGRCSIEPEAVPSRINEYPSTYPGGDYLESLREAAQECLRTLKEERRKVEGFKRELPLCIQLLDEAIKSAEEKLVHGKDEVLPMPLTLPCSLVTETDSGSMSPENRRPSLEEFMPLKRRERDGQPSHISSDGEPRDDHCGTKKTTHPAWMVEPQLRNQTTTRSTDLVPDEKKMMPEMMREPEHSEQEHSSVTSSQQQRPTGGAFVPFQRRELQQPPTVVSRPQPRSGGFCADLNLCVQDERPATSPGDPHTLRAASDVEVGSIDAAAATAPQTPDALETRKDMGSMAPGNVDTSGAGNNSGGGGNSSSSTRKARRCWSPELHHRFVHALHQLGGSHIATPKQLRELMKVDGLTNDEVKSHLQKYRLHTARRPSSSSSPRESATAAAGQSSTPQLLVVGGIWMPPQHASPAASQPGSHSGVSDPSQPSQFCHSPSFPLDYFAACINNGIPAAGPPMQMLLHRQPIFESPHPGASQSQTSPQGLLQVTSQLSGATQGSSSETYESGEEEAKSQSTSWKFCRRSAVCTT